VSRESCSSATGAVTRTFPKSASVERGPDVLKVRSLTELCGLRVSVETTSRRKALYSASAASSSAIRSATEDRRPAVLLVVRITIPGMFYPKVATSVLQLWRKPHG